MMPPALFRAVLVLFLLGIAHSIACRACIAHNTPSPAEPASSVQERHRLSLSGSSVPYFAHKTYMRSVVFTESVS
ncbi:MAG: hypothetical protein ABF479_20930 [Gluconacetobacter sp.]|uniref:Uncharacterized protein n=1 Tax=Gluconacetobacter dulcium TaxID=2729096 RepID=A0A7W4PGK6_9PROT|nr:hypothetical protein [Gluconacetobacter dulcium]MBB2197287.1 hypothetical protein [Gluconacetobacter dulcium]